MFGFLKLGAAGKASLVLSVIIIALVMAFNFLSIISGKTGSTGYPPMPVIVGDFIENIPFITISLVCGAIGAYLKILIERNSFVDMGVAETAREIFTRNDSDLIIIGSWLGVIGYFFLESKMFLRVLYNKVNYNEAEIHFVPLAFIAMFFGYFARELVSTASKHLVARINKKTINLNDRSATGLARNNEDQ